MELLAGVTYFVPMGTAVMTPAEMAIASPWEDTAEVTDGSHTGIPTCRSMGAEVTVVNFGP